MFFEPCYQNGSYATITVPVDYGGLTPAIYTLTLTNGRTFTGTLVSGSLVIQ